MAFLGRVLPLSSARIEHCCRRISVGPMDRREGSLSTQLGWRRTRQRCAVRVAQFPCSLSGLPMGQRGLCSIAPPRDLGYLASLPGESAPSERARCNSAGVRLPDVIWFRAHARSSRSYARRQRSQQNRCRRPPVLRGVKERSHHGQRGWVMSRSPPMGFPRPRTHPDEDWTHHRCEKPSKAAAVDAVGAINWKNNSGE
jgi:hypothetical protein